MARAEAPDEVREGAQPAQDVSVLIGVAGTVDMLKLQTAADALAPAFAVLRSAQTSGAVCVAYPCPATESCPEEETAAGVRLLPYEAPSAGSALLPWLTSAGVYEGLFRLAERRRAAACVVLHPDLAALTPQAVSALAAPLLARECDLIMPVYPTDRYEGLINFGILEPLTRALYGRRIQFPLPVDFALSGALAGAIAQGSGSRSASQGQALLWPTAEAVMRERKICQAALDVHHEFSTEGVDLSAILTQILGPFFADMERHAPFWQRIRGSQTVPMSGVLTPPRSDGRDVDPRSMVEAFQLGYRNLQDVWSLVLPPITLLELKRISRSTPDAFRMPDELWAHIVYDFALAHRLRTLGRGHLLGALTPLYLGWAASYVAELRNLSLNDVEARRERLGRAFENAKPYLLQRWRWPDRFNP